MTHTTGRSISPGYQIFMLALCLYALGTLAVQSIVRLSPSTTTILDYSDVAICVVFFIDFLISLASAPNRWKYFRTWGWLDLLSSIPTVDIARWGRLGRILRVIRVLRGLRVAKLVATVVVRRRVENTFLVASMIAILLVVFCSIAVLHFETTADANILKADDALWWAFATITTVGYGDYYPVTGEGRVVAMVLMAAGVGLFGTFSAFLAAWLLGPGAEESDSDTELSGLRQEVSSLRETIEAMRQQQRPNMPLWLTSGAASFTSRPVVGPDSTT